MDSVNYRHIHVCSCYLPASSWWMRSAKFGSSPHQKSQSSRRPCLWLRRHTLSTSAFRQRLKLHRMGSSSVTGNSIGAEMGPCHTNLFHLIPVRSACNTREGGGSLGVQSCCFKIHSAPSREHAEHSLKNINQAFWSRPPSYQAYKTVPITSEMTREQRKFWVEPKNVYTKSCFYNMFIYTESLQPADPEIGRTKAGICALANLILNIDKNGCIQAEWISWLCSNDKSIKTLQNTTISKQDNHKVGSHLWTLV